MSFDRELVHLLEILASPAAVLEISAIKRSVDTLVALHPSTNLGRNQLERMFQVFCCCFSLCISPSPFASSVPAQDTLFSCAMSLYRAFNIQNHIPAQDILQVFLKVAHSLGNSLSASECLVAAREVVKQRSAKDTSKDQEHGDLLAQILVESYSVALRLESKAMQANVAAELSTLLQLAANQAGLIPAALEACKLGLTKAVELLEQRVTALDTAEQVLVLLRQAWAILQASWPAHGHTNQVQELQVQVLLLYVPSCIQAGMSNEALAASLAYLEAHVCGTGSWWNVWLLALHARIAAKDHVQAAREVHTRVCGAGEGDERGMECPADILCDVLTLLASCLPSFAAERDQVNQCADTYATILVSAATQAAAKHGPCIADPLTILTEQLLGSSSYSINHMAGAEREKLVLQLLSDRAVVRVLSQAEEELRIRTCSAIHLHAAQLYQARELERARELCASTLLYAPPLHFGSAAKSVAYCDLKLQRYREALSNLELAEQELGGLGSVSMLMGMRACLHLQDWEGAKAYLRKALHCIDFKSSHLQVAYTEAMAMARGPEAAGAAECAVLSIQLLQECWAASRANQGIQGGEVGPDCGEWVLELCPGRMCSQMLAALALLQPPVESAHNRRAWIDQIMAELAWARRVMDQEEKGNPQTESQGLYLIHASFGVGLLSLEWRCWDAAAESMRMAASFASIVPSSQAHGHTLKQHDLLQLVCAIAAMHAQQQQQQQQQGSHGETEAAMQCYNDLYLRLSSFCQSHGKDQVPLSHVLAHAAKICLAAIQQDSSKDDPTSSQFLHDLLQLV